MRGRNSNTLAHQPDRCSRSIVFERRDARIRRHEARGHFGRVGDTHTFQQYGGVLALPSGSIAHISTVAPVFARIICIRHCGRKPRGGWPAAVVSGASCTARSPAGRQSRTRTSALPGGPRRQNHRHPLSLRIRRDHDRHDLSAEAVTMEVAPEPAESRGFFLVSVHRIKGYSGRQISPARAARIVRSPSARRVMASRPRRPRPAK